jgi:hypothetical protein
MKSQLLTLTLLAVLMPGNLFAQEPIDSLRMRLERAERMLEMLRVQMADAVESKVEPQSGFKVNLSGLILVNSFYTSARVNNTDIPTVVLPPDAANVLPARALGAAARQSRIGLSVSAPGVLNGEFNGDIEISFFGGHLANGRFLPLLSIRRLRGELRWSNVWLMFGQESPPISDVDPSSLAAMELPGFTQSGNLWYWMPQVVLGAETSGNVRLGLEAALVAPMAGPGQPQSIVTQPNDAERTGKPFVQGRLITRWGDPSIDGGEVSIGGHYGWIATGTNTEAISKALALGARFLATEFVEIRAEGFTGQALGTLGGGGIGQNFGPNGQPVRSKGGWAQVNLLPAAAWEFGGGIGVDDPNDVDLSSGTTTGGYDPYGGSGNTVYDYGAGVIRSNLSWETHLIWRPHPVVFGLEFKRIKTVFGDPTVGTQTAHHVNLAMGFEF